MGTNSNRPAAVVTGGRQGLGKGAAVALAHAGFDVVIVDLLQDEKLQQTIAEVESRGARAAFVRGDIADLDEQAALVESAWSVFGGIDCLVNNAGVAARPLRDVLEVKAEEFDRNITVNLRGTFFLTQKVASRMIVARRTQFHRSIIVVTSIAAGIVSLTRAEYCMSKAGLSMMTQIFATRLAQEGIHVHEIRPGLMRTEMTEGAAPQTAALIDSGFVPMRRWGEPGDIGATVSALATAALPFTTGQSIFVDGGLHIPRIG